MTRYERKQSVLKTLRGNRILKESLEYCYYLSREAVNKWTYINALIVGSIINGFTDGFLIVPYVVPLFVQALAKASVNYVNRNVNTLLQLPAQREDPAFIMDLQGNVMLSTGKTSEVFEHFSVGNVRDFIGKKGLEAIIKNIDLSCSDTDLASAEVYSDKTDKWYEVRAKPIEFLCGANPNRFLVWFRDISFRKAHDLRQQDLLQYSSWLVPHVKEFVQKKSIYDNLASFILGNYEAVFVTRADERGNLSGSVYKRNENSVQRSEPISISEGSLSPLLLSRRKSRVVSDDAANFASIEMFQSEYPFDRRVKDFIGRPITNFINYHEGDVSIIAFNCKKKITIYEEMFIEALLNLSRSFVALIDLARENDEQFLQKVMGLCAAAEYSDEITGKHILRVNAYSRFVAMEIGCDQAFVDTIGQIAALHDIGKVAIPELIKLPRGYSPEERLKMQMHTIYGAQIIETMMKYAAKEDPRLVMARNIALHHHQTCNGKGYPFLKKNGEIINPIRKDYRYYAECEPLSADEIPIEGLIVGLADRYDALRSRRPYKDEFSHAKTREIMNSDDRISIKGAEWYGSELWPVFEEHHTEFERIYEDMRDKATLF